MQIFTDSDSSIILIGGIVVVVLIILYLLWRSGWSLQNLKKLKIGPVEGERFDEGKENGAETGQSFSEIDVQVHNSKFEGDVGDIAGVIIKSEQKDEDEDEHTDQDKS